VTAARRTLANPSALAVTFGFYAVVASTMGALWRIAARGHGGVLAGYSATQLTWYLATSEAVTVSLNSRLIERIGDEIGAGAVGVELLRPASVLGVRMAGEIGACLPRVAGCGVVGAVLASATGGRVVNVGSAALAVPALVLAVTCNLLAQHAVAAASFWLRDAR